MTSDVLPVVHVVDDDDAVRDSLDVLLRLHGHATRTFADGEAFLASVSPRTRGCVLLDLRMPGLGGLGVQGAMAERGIEMPIVVLTAHGDAATARAALKAGAFDFLEKPVDDRLLVDTVAAAHHADATARSSRQHRDDVARRLARLTPREREVLDLVVAGRHNREIAIALGISPRTVETYKAKLQDKLQVDRLPELIRVALEGGIGESPRG